MFVGLKSFEPRYKSPLQRLPLRIQIKIYELAGPDPIAKAAWKNLSNVFKTGRIGIPSWEISIVNNNNGNTYEHSFIGIPVHRYCYNKITEKIQKFSDDLDNYHFTNLVINPLVFIVCYFDISHRLRRDCFMDQNTHYIRNEDGGCFQGPGIPLTFRDAYDYTVLYSLKEARGKNVKDALNNLERWRERTPEDPVFVNKIMAKWQELALLNKNICL